MACHRRGHHGWCWTTLLLTSCILDVSISGERAGREPRVATTGTLTGHGGNTQPRGHHVRSWRRGWCHPGSAGKSPPVIGQDKPALLVASKLRLGSSLRWRRPTRHHARSRPSARPVGKLVSSTGGSGVPELSLPPSTPTAPLESLSRDGKAQEKNDCRQSRLMCTGASEHFLFFLWGPHFQQ